MQCLKKFYTEKIFINLFFEQNYDLLTKCMKTSYKIDRDLYSSSFKERFPNLDFVQSYAPMHKSLYLMIFRPILVPGKL